MTVRGKKYKKAQDLLDRKKLFPVQEGMTKVKELAYARFDETVSVDVNLGIDPTKGEQAVRGSVVLPHGMGKKIRVVAFAKGDAADEARKAGADVVGAEDLVERVIGGWMDFEYAVATPDMMGMVGKVAKILGPRGLLPNKKNGTVAEDLTPVIHELKKGLLFFKNDKSGLVHFSFGKVSFSPEHLKDNLEAFMAALVAAKPATSKGKFIKKVTASSTMGPGIHLLVETL